MKPADAPPGGSKLASNKYFKPQELNDLARIGKGPLPGKRKDSAQRRPVVNNKPSSGAAAASGRPLVVRNTADLKKIEAPKTI